AVDDDVADIDADANLDALCLWHAGIALRHPALNLDRATQCFHDAFEFREDAVAGALDDPPAMLVDLGVEELASVGFQPRERALLVGAHQSAVAGDVSRENGREPPYDSLGGHLGMPCCRVVGVTLLSRPGCVHRAWGRREMQPVRARSATPGRPRGLRRPT